MSVSEAMNIHTEMAKLRDEKITRFIGFSAHGYFDKALALIKSVLSTNACCPMLSPERLRPGMDRQNDRVTQCVYGPST